MMARSMLSDALPKPANQTEKMHMRKTQMVSAVCLGLGMSMAFSLSAQAQDANANGDVSYLHNFPRDNVSLTLVGGAKQPLGDVQVGDVYDASIGMGLALNDRALISFGYDPRVSSARPGRTDACRFDAYRPGQPAGGRPVQDQRPPQLERGAEPRRHARHTRRHPDRASPDDVLIDMRATENVVCASGRRPAAFRRSHYVFTGPTPAIGSAAACCRRS